MARTGIPVTPGHGGGPLQVSTRTLANGDVVDTQLVGAAGADGSQSTRVVSVSTSAAPLATLLEDRVALMVHNYGTVRVYLGGSDVTADDAAGTGGWILEPNEKQPLGFSAAITIYGRTASGTGTVRVWQVS